MRFTVAIMGRPNVGKSTLFNRLCGGRQALVDSTPGVTRDRREGNARLGDLEFTVIDTAGLEETVPEGMERRMQDQSAHALDDANVALLLFDARAGLTPMDRHFADWVRRSKTPVVLVANKCEQGSGEVGILESFELGLGEPVAVSAEHGEGLVDLFEALKEYGEEEEPNAGDEPAEEEQVDGELRLAIVGRPNVGKSTLVNRLIGEERVITGPEPGVTRDAISVQWSWQGRKIRLVDTAGMRRRSRIQEKLEKLSVGDSLRAIRFAEVVVLVLDAGEKLERQDLSIAEHVVKEGRALIIVLNKWDLITGRGKVLEAVADRLGTSLSQLPGVVVVTVSALTGDGVAGLLPAVIKAFDTWNRRLPTAQLNRWFSGVIEHHSPPVVKGRHLQLRYITQVNIRPPSFVIFASRPEALPDAYHRYLINDLRKTFKLEGVPIRLMLRRGKNPYAENKSGGSSRTKSR